MQIKPFWNVAISELRDMIFFRKCYSKKQMLLNKLNVRISCQAIFKSCTLILLRCMMKLSSALVH